MSSLVLELQKDALNRQIAVSDLLRKAYVAARELKVSEMHQWVERELNGYKGLRGKDIPPYRHIRGQISAYNPFHGWQPILMPWDEDGSSPTRPCAESVAELEDLLKASGGSRRLIWSLPDSVVQKLQTAIEFDLQIAFLVSPAQITGILDAVRNIVLKWSMDLEERGIRGENMQFTANERAEAAAIGSLTQIIYGSNVQIQQATSQSAQLGYNAESFSLEEIHQLLELMKAASEALSSDHDRDAIRTEIASAELQLKSPKPNKGVIREALLSAKRIFEGAGGAALGNAIPAILAKIGELFPG